jgi:tripartite-type tricarboxylate transporter receptor subunit TctC
MITKRRFLSIGCVGGLASVAPSIWQAARAQEWPTKPIRIIESFPAGIGRDARTRVIAEKLSGVLGQQVYVENRPGAGGRIGLQAAVSAPPDGYTFNTFGAIDALAKYLYNLPYDPERDLVPVTLIETLPMAVVVRASLPARSLGELISYAKEHPGEMTYGSTGAGSGFHLNALEFMNLSDVNLRHVPYGQGNLMGDLLGGHIDMVFDAVPAYLENLKAGKLRALALTGDKRATVLPDVPTFIEIGIPAYDRFATFGLAAPKGTPETIVAKMQKALSQIVQEPALRRQWISEGGNPVGSTSAEFAALIHSLSERWGKIVRANNLKIE